ncbi:MAG: chorismate synthase [Planctomycetes bacterium]|nr:chorismate synthase [Planctomycetota bacterium]
MTLTYQTAGESHGPAVIATLGGFPFGHTLDVDWINSQLKRRQGGYGRGGRQNLETDHVEFLSGMRKATTIGSPLTLLIPNLDSRIDKAPDLHNVRPGHVDMAGILKLGSNNARDVLERASARETAGRVAAGAACQSLLREFGIEVVAHVLRIGSVEADSAYGVGQKLILNDPKAAVITRDKSDVYTLNQAKDAQIKQAIDSAKEAGDTLGGSIEIVATNLPVGLGSHNQYSERLDGQLALALMSIQAMKSVEIGLGSQVSGMLGSQVHDPIIKRAEVNPRAPYARTTNNAGGLEGGTTNGEPLVCRVHMKPISTLMNPLPTIDVSTGEAAKASTERSDTCALSAAAIVAECAVAIVLAQALLAKTGGDSLIECKRNFDSYIASLKGYA